MEINQNSSGMMNGIPPVSKQEKKIGPIIGILIVVLIIIIAVLYFFTQNLNKVPVTEQTPAPITTEQSTSTATSSVSDEANDAALEADLDAQLQDVDYSF